jgi:fibronectin-binding autotransporter adhesin
MLRRRPVLASALAVTLALAMNLSPAAAEAATVTWLGTEFSWDVPAGWSPSSIPTAADDVILPTPLVPLTSITLAAGDVAKSLTVNDTYSLDGYGTGTLTLGGAVNVATGKTLTLNSVSVSGTSPLGKLGAGTMTLTAGSVLSGVTDIQLKAGTLALDNVSTDTANRLGGAGVSFYGGTLALIGNEFAASAESAGDATLALGTSSITLTRTAATYAPTLTLARLTRTAGSGTTINFTKPAAGTLGGTTAADPKIIITNPPAVTNSIMGAWATTGTATILEWAGYGANGAYSITSGADFTNTIADGAKNVRYNAAQSVTANATIYSLNRYGNAAVSLSDDVELNIAGGGFIASGTNNAQSMTSVAGGTDSYLTAGGTAAGELIVHATQNTFTIGSATAGSGVILRDNRGADGVVGGGDDGAVTLVKAGAGTLVLANGNTYSGGTIVHAGTLQASTGAFDAAPASPLGTGNATLNGGILQLRTPGVTGAGTVGTTTAETVTFGNNVTVGDAVTIDVNRSTGFTVSTNKTIALGRLTIGATQLGVTGGNTYALKFSDVTLTGAATFSPTTAVLFATDVSGPFALTKAGTGTMTLTDASTYSGGTILNAGTLQASAATFAAAPASPLGSGSLLLNGGTLQFRTPGVMGTGTVGSTAPETVTFAHDVTVGGPATINVDRTTGFTVSSNKTITLGSLSIGASQLSVTGGNAYALRFGDVTLTEAATFSPSSASLTVRDVSGPFALTKSGSGAMTVTGVLSGPAPTVTAGTLNGVQAGSFGTGTITLAGGTLRAASFGSVIYPNPVNVTAAATISPGDNFGGVWGGAQAVKKFGDLALNGALTLKGAGSAYNSSSSNGTTLTFASTAVAADTTITTADSNPMYVNLGTVTGGANLGLGGNANWVFVMDQPGQFAGLGSLVLNSGSVLNVAVADANLGNVNVAAGTLRLSAAQGAGTTPTAAIAGKLDINTDIGAGVNLAMAPGSGITSTSATAATPVPVAFAGSLKLQGITTVSTGGITLSGNVRNDDGYTTGALTMNGKGILALSGNNGSLGTSGSVAVSALGGVVQFANAAALPAGTIAADTNGAVSFAYDGATAVPNTVLPVDPLASLGVFAVDTANTQALNFSASSLRLGSAVAGSVSGMITPKGATYALGGGGGTLTVLSNLDGFVGVEMNTSGTLAAGRVILKGNNGYTGTTEITAGTLQLDSANAAKSSTAINVNGNATSKVFGALLLDPTIPYNATMPVPVFNGGVIGWTTAKTLTSLPGVYGLNRVLGLGGDYSADITANFPITDDGGLPVSLLKTGPAVLDLSGNVTNNYTGGTSIIGGEIKVADGRELGGGTINFGYGAATRGIIHFTDNGTLGNILRIAAGDWQNNGGFNVDADKAVTLTGDLAELSAGNRGCITKLGKGTLRLLPANPYIVADSNRWGVDLAEGIFETNQMPDNGAPAASNGNGQFQLRGGTLHFVAGGPAFTASAGIGALIVNADTTSTIDVDAGLFFKTIGHNGNQFYGELIKAGQGVYQAGSWTGGAQYARGNGTVNVRAGTLIAGGGLVSGSSGTSRALSDYSGFTLKIQDGTQVYFAQATGPVACLLNGNLYINNEYAGAGTPVAKVAGYKLDVTKTPYGYDTAIGDLGLQTAGAGTTDWSGTLQVLAGTANLNRDAGATVALSAARPATLKIDAGATVNVSGSGDILTDTATPTRHVGIENNGSFNILYNNGTTGNAKAAGSITGAGSTTVYSDTSLTADSIVQDTLTIAAGGSVTIRESTGGGVSVVPEPGTWALVSAGLLSWLAFRRRREAPNGCRTRGPM